MGWKPEYSVGIDAIDSQHRQIFEHLLAIENSIEKRDPWHVIRYLVEQLAGYLKFHFAVEESLLEIIGFPGLAEHRQGHAGLNGAIRELETRLKEKGSPADLLDFFEQWFIRHVLEGDRLYVAYARQRFPGVLVG